MRKSPPTGPFTRPPRGRRYLGTWHENGKHHWVWYVDRGLAARIGVPNATKHANAHIAFNPSDDYAALLHAHLTTHFPGLWTIEEMDLPPGGYYPRMARPSDQHPTQAPGSYPASWEFQHERAVMQGQLLSLKQQLEQICRYVHPEKANLKSYSHEIRNLLILACTEVEASFQAILSTNGYTKARLTTADFVKLNGAMKLDEYGFGLPTYPWLPTTTPFAGWSAAAPTKTLSWYDAYNEVKHNREVHFPLATLSAAMNAVCATAVLICAQFGHDAFGNSGGLESFFHLEAGPAWRYSQIYTYPYDNYPYVAVQYPF